MDVLPLDSLGSVHGQFYRVADGAERPLCLIPHESDQIEGGAVLLVLANERDLRAWYDDGNGHEVSIVTKAEISGGKVDRKIRAGKVGLQLLLQLALAIFFCRMREIARCIVTPAKVEFEARPALDLHGDPAETSISRGIVAPIANQIIKGRVLAQLLEYRLKVVRIDECQPAGIRR